MFALADCNNFYASCERVFNPKLKNRPIVVLSNNDGCIIARSQEAKDLGIPMGGPAFKCKNLFAKYNVKVFSANFTLYGDLSHRVMKILSQCFPEIEIYSIDESFLSLDNIHTESLTNYCTDVRNDILKSTGIPLSIGIGSTKTLAKIASHCAKTPQLPHPPLLKRGDSGELEGAGGVGVFNWNEVEDQDGLLSKTPIEEIWGVGWKTSAKLNSLGIYTALQLKNCNDLWIRKMFNVTMLRTVSELRGISCLPLESVIEPRKGIMSSRGFGKPVTKLSELEEAVSTYVSRACEKLIEQGSAASHVYVSIKTNKHRTEEIYYFNYRITSVPSATWYVPDLIKAALDGLHQIYKPGLRYKKATVMLLGIIPKNQIQINMFSGVDDFNKIDKINNAITSINRDYGSEFIKYGSTGIKQNWRMKKEMCSPRYTTSWNEILKIRI